MAEASPFQATERVPVRGGVLHVERAGRAPAEAAVVVLAVHGITASHAQWRAVARHLIEREGLCLLAPDLRGRGRSAGLPPPEGIANHVEDLLAVLDHVGARRAVLVGHSMGAYVVASAAAAHQERAPAVVMIDGGLRMPVPPDADVDAVLLAVLGPALERLRRTFASEDEYIAFWQAHPAFRGRWDDDVEAYVRYDLTGPPGVLRSVVVEDAVRADGASMLRDPSISTAAEHIAAPMTLVRAGRGLLDDDNPVIPPAFLEEFSAAHPDARVENLEDLNHYTVVIGRSGGARRVAELVAEAAAVAD
ncbi:MAG: alpha/beta fold hydrolase [Thermoleophilaceae bacterium]|nr:alpha/beta fold hydrolase [Thermoleophilaceae bacterium]